MIDYQTFHEIRRLRDQNSLTMAQIALELQVTEKTVAKWLQKDHFEPRKKQLRECVSEPFRGRIAFLLSCHNYSARQIFRILSEEGYKGSYSTLKPLVREFRPKKVTPYLKLNFEPGEAAQVDFGYCGYIRIGNERRRLYVFVMVLAHSRMMYIEFILKQSLEHFLQCHRNAFEYFKGVPQKVMVDNCKAAVIQAKSPGKAPVFNENYAHFADFYGFKPVACNARQPQEKGRVERSIHYVKQNFLCGRELEYLQLDAVNAAAQLWLTEEANVRIHTVTRQQPVEMFKQSEQPNLMVLPVNVYSCRIVKTMYADRQFRFKFETNSYSVPPVYAAKLLHIHIYPDILCVYHNERLIAQHPRSYQRHQDFEKSEHVIELLDQRKSAQEQKFKKLFCSLSPQAEQYYRQLCEKRLNYREEIHKILALIEIYSESEVIRAIADALELNVYSHEYILNLLQQRKQPLTEPRVLHLTRKSELLERKNAQVDLNVYNLKAKGSPNDKQPKHS